VTTRTRRSLHALVAGLLTATLLAGCIGPSREERLDPMVGQDVDVAIETMGQPDETVSLGDGRHAYRWQRIYDYEMEHRAMVQSNRHRPHWLFEEPAFVDARLCTTQLIVGFDFLIESWDYGCETIQIEKDTWRAQPLIPSHRRTTKPAL
jgi:hypothetical protein